MTTNKSITPRRCLLPLALVVLLVGLGSTTSLAKELLRWKFKEGDVFHYSLEQTALSTGKDPSGLEVKTTNSLIMDMTWKVKSVDASGVATLTQTIDRMRTSASSPLGKFSSDSKEAGDSTSPLFKMLIGAEFTSKMKPSGEQTELALPEKLLAALKSNSDPAVSMGQLSEAALKNNFAQLVFPLAESAVGPGETWQRKMAIPAGPDGQTRQIEQTFTDKGPNSAAAGLETIEFTTKFEPHKADPNIPVTFKSESVTGRIDFDNSAGRLAKSNVVEDVELSVSFEGKELPTRVVTTRILTLAKDKSP
jgi:hypothetical protein